MQQALHNKTNHFCTLFLLKYIAIKLSNRYTVLLVLRIFKILSNCKKSHLRSKQITKLKKIQLV